MQGKAARPGASRIQVQHIVSYLRMRTMGVAGNDDGKSRGFGIQAEIEQIVEDVALHAASLDDVSQRQRLRPWARICVCAYSKGRRNLAQAVEDLRIAHVPGVDDQIRPVERGDGLGTKQAVRIGD